MQKQKYNKKLIKKHRIAKLNRIKDMQKFIS